MQGKIIFVLNFGLFNFTVLYTFFLHFADKPHLNRNHTLSG